VRQQRANAGMLGNHQRAPDGILRQPDAATCFFQVSGG
jgi:hypothetical protein